MAAAEQLESKIKAALNDDACIVQIVDQSNSGCDGGKFEALIVSDTFEGVALLERHKRINAILADELKRIHAFSMKTWTQKQWLAKQQQQQPPKQ